MPTAAIKRPGFITGVLGLLLISVLLTTFHLLEIAIDDVTVSDGSISGGAAGSGAAGGDYLAAEDAEDAEAEDAISVLIPLEVEQATVAAQQLSSPVSPSTYVGPERRLAGDGCHFELCPADWGAGAPNVPWTPTEQTVAGRPSTALPRLYIIVPFRNRLDNLARLISSINNSTTPQQRACMCIVVADFDTRVGAVPEWKNRSCLATWDRRSVYLADADVTADARDIKLDDIVAGMQPRPCPGSMYGFGEAEEGGGDEEGAVAQLPALRSDDEGHGLAVTVTPGFFLPLHVDVTGLRDPDPTRYILGLFDGSSALVDAKEFVDSAKVMFSRAGGITAGLHAVAEWEQQDEAGGGDPLVFILDTDMLIRPGFVEQIFAYPVRGSTVFYPICWHVCFGMGLKTFPRAPTTRASRAGFWRNGGYGMVGAYLSDLRRVKGMSEMARKGSWGSEDELLYKKLVKRFRYKVVRPNSEGLVHMYHSRFKDWSKSSDGMFGGGSLGPLVKHVCNAMGNCVCPKGTTPKEVAKRIASFTKSAVDFKKVG